MISLRKAAVIGLISALAGLICLLVAWLGVSGTRVISDQLSYMASGTVTGLFLLGMGAGVLFYDLANHNSQQLYLLQLQIQELRDGVLLPDERYLRQEGDAQASGGLNGHVHGPQRLVTLPGSNRVHWSTCALMQGRENMQDIDPYGAVSESLSPCRICKPQLSEMVGA